MVTHGLYLRQNQASHKQKALFSFIYVGGVLDYVWFLSLIRPEYNMETSQMILWPITKRKATRTAKIANDPNSAVNWCKL